MPDAHLGIGATVGSVIPTENAIIPAAVGVDIGCGMAAVRTDLAATDLPDSLDAMLGDIAAAIPAGLGQEQSRTADTASKWFDVHRPRTDLDDRLVRKTLRQFGTLGSGNHFVEVCLDEDQTVWVVLHSGSRGVGNQLATATSPRRRTSLAAPASVSTTRTSRTSSRARRNSTTTWPISCGRRTTRMANRDAMVDAALAVLFRAVGRGRERERVNCHHNYTDP